MKKVLAISSVLLGVVFLAGCGQQPVSQTQPTTPASTTQQLSQQNDIIIGQDYEKNQVSSQKLSYGIPENWIRDENSIKKMGLYDILVPKGGDIQSSNQSITIAFQKKDLKNEDLSTLQNFFKADMQNTINMFPNAKFERWQPESLNPDKINFMSIEIYSEQKDQPSPARLLMIDANDGYYSITLTVEDRKILSLPIFIDFFNGIGLMAPTSK